MKNPGWGPGLAELTATADYQAEVLKSKVGVPAGRKLTVTDWASSGLMFRLAEVSTASNEMERLRLSLRVPPLNTRSV